jgi:hypothetical protein
MPLEIPSVWHSMDQSQSSWEADGYLVPSFMETKSSLPCTQEPAIYPCSEPDESSPHFPTRFP